MCQLLLVVSLSHCAKWRRSRFYQLFRELDGEHQLVVTRCHTFLQHPATTSLETFTGPCPCGSKSYLVYQLPQADGERYPQRVQGRATRSCWERTAAAVLDKELMSGVHQSAVCTNRRMMDTHMIPYAICTYMRDTASKS